MKERAFKRMVARDGYLDDEESLRAYSYDASGAEGKPRLVLKPTHIEELRRIIVHANQHQLPLVPRGSGTGKRAGCVRTDAIIVDVRGFKSVERLDTQRHTVDVGAGTTVRELNKSLARHGYIFPLTPSNREATIGGLLAQNHATSNSFLHGDYHDIVEQVECFDGLGRFQTLKRERTARVIGCEGTTGVVTKARLKVVKEGGMRTMELLPVKNVAAALAAAEKRSGEKGVSRVEYLDADTAALLHLPLEEHVLVTYENDDGSYKDLLKVTTLVTTYDALEGSWWRRGYLKVEEVMVTTERVAGFIGHCKKKGWPCWGSLGTGILHVALPRKVKRDVFWTTARSLGVELNGEEGYGRVKKAFVPEGVRKRLRRLKEEQDYNNILNPGVIV